MHNFKSVIEIGGMAGCVLLPATALAQKAIPNCAITLIAPGDAKEDLQTYYEALASYDAKSVGGKVPDETFYSISY